MVYYINRFLYVEISLHSRNKSQLGMVVCYRCSYMPHTSSAWIQIEETRYWGHVIPVPERKNKSVNLFNDSYSFFWELVPLVLLIHHLSEDIHNQTKCQWQREAQQPTYQKAGIYNLLWKQQWIVGKIVHATTLILSLSCSTILTTMNKL